MNKRSEAVKKWRKNTKLKIIQALGGKCCICGYDRCGEALEFHHVDPTEKDFHWGTINGNIRGWEIIKQEMKKCVCVCSNCHKEVHASFVSIPDNAQRFDESLIPAILTHNQEVYDNCPVCNNLKPKTLKTCSVECANKRRIRVVDWTQHDVLKLVEHYKTFQAVGDILGVSGAAVARKYKQKLHQVVNEGGSIPPTTAK